ncbi:hypothetical protein LPJ55_005890, partial [Coemansia sp. RSA 990]
MKLSNIVFALAYAAASTASTGYVSSVPAAAAPKLPPAPSTSAQPIAVTPIPVVIADFIYSPVAPAIPAAPTPASSAVYAAKAAPSVPSSAAPANPMPEPSMTMVPLPAPVPTSSQAYHAYANNKRSIDQDSLQGLVSGTNAMLFNVNGNSYILTRLPLDLATKAAQNPSVLRKRATENDMIADATTKDLGSDAVLYDLVGKIFARITLPINANVGISNPTEDGGLLKRDDLLENLLGEVVASAVAPVNIIANINPDEDGNGLVPNLLGRVSATIQASPTVTAHIFDSDKDDSGELLKRDDLLENLLGEVVASAVAPVNIIANINPDEDGNGLVPNLLGRVSATIQASPTVTAHIFDSDKDDSGELLKRDDLLENLLGEVVASAVAPVNIIANINPDEDGNGLVPNLLGRVSATIQASPTVTAHIFDSDKDDSGELLKRDDLLENLLGEVVASAVAPVNIIANINPDEDGNGL